MVMKIIDLSQPLYDKMPVFPGDPEVIIQEVHSIEKNGWNMKNMTFTTHIGTHVNAPYHMVQAGEKLDVFPLDRFIGHTELYKKGITMKRNRGVFFTSCNIDAKIVQQILLERPKFIGLSDKFELDIAIEKTLLEAGILSFENLANTEKLPKVFMFYGVPLNIKESDGSPVRAFAVIE